MPRLPNRSQVLPFRAGRLDSRQRDALRVAVQTAVACGATYAVVSWMDLPHVSWAVISALFTIQPHADATLRSAAGRFAGAVIGVAIGLLSVSLLGGESTLLSRIVLATGVSGLISGYWPILRYTGVAAVVMALHRDPEIAGAAVRALVILIGSAAGAAATFLVWPELARNRAARLLREALESILQLLDDILRGINEGKADIADPANARFLKSFSSARSVASKAWFKPRFSSGTPLSQALYATESLWHGLIILHRVVRDERPLLEDQTSRALLPALEEVHQCASGVVRELIAGLKSRLSSVNVPVDPLRQSVDRAKSLINDELMESEDGPGRRALATLGFALDQVDWNLVEITQLLVSGKRAERPPPSRPQ